MNDVTSIINQINAGQEQASENLLPLVYDELRRLASDRMRDERTSHTLTPTALVHEAYLRLVGNKNSVNWNGSAHFFGAASEAMRRILVDHARGKNAEKRGGDATRFELVESWLVDDFNANDLIELDDALNKLEESDSQAATLVKLRFFAGMTNKQAAEQLGMSPRKSDMVWAFARSWLKRAMSEND